MALQWLVVALVVIVAAVYSVRTFLRQFERSDDEASACGKCAAREVVERARELQA